MCSVVVIQRMEVMNIMCWVPFLGVIVVDVWYKKLSQLLDCTARSLSFVWFYYGYHDI